VSTLVPYFFFFCVQLAICVCDGALDVRVYLVGDHMAIAILGFDARGYAPHLIDGIALCRSRPDCMTSLRLPSVICCTDAPSHDLLGNGHIRLAFYGLFVNAERVVQHKFDPNNDGLFHHQLVVGRSRHYAGRRIGDAAQWCRVDVRCLRDVGGDLFTLFSPQQGQSLLRQYHRFVNTVPGHRSEHELEADDFRHLQAQQDRHRDLVPYHVRHGHTVGAYLRAVLDDDFRRPM
jgi:hypothetical protein